jgi:hypothetical protein
MRDVQQGSSADPQIAHMLSRECSTTFVEKL